MQHLHLTTPSSECARMRLQVHTPLTARARELLQLYRGLQLPLLGLEERLDVLLHAKWTVKEFDCDLTRELVDLVRCSVLFCCCCCCCRRRRRRLFSVSLLLYFSCFVLRLMLCAVAVHAPPRWSACVI